MDKKELRKTCKALRKAFSREERRSADEKIRESILGLPVWKETAPLFSYVSTEEEPDTRELIRIALREGKRVFVPRCLEKPWMEAVEIRSLSDLCPGRMGLLEPVETLPATNLVETEDLLALVPCIAAGRDGRRLGHGGGYYDVFLSKVSAKKICLCYEKMIFPDLPMTSGDIWMDAVVTERGVFYK